MTAGLLSACGGSTTSNGTAAQGASADTTVSGSGATTSTTPASASGTGSAIPLAHAVTLSWQPPTQNVDGTPLTLSGYSIYYGTQSQNYTDTIQVDNPGLATYVIDNLPPGTYYLAMTSNGADGSQSDLSPEVVAQVD